MPGQAARGDASGLTALAQTDGVDFVLRITAETKVDSRGLENPDRLAGWNPQESRTVPGAGRNPAGGHAGTSRRPGRTPQCRARAKRPGRLVRGLVRETFRAGEIRDWIKKESNAMGFLSFFSKPPRPLLQLHSGSFSLDRGGGLLATTLPFSFPPALILEIGRCVVDTFRDAQTAQLTLDELVVHYPGLITALVNCVAVFVFLDDPGFLPLNSQN